jgi:hypothetical protein
LNINTNSNSDAYDKSWIYKLKYGRCSVNYIGQTGGSFKIRYKEHINDIRYNRLKTGYSQHILNTGHERAFDITSLNIMEVQLKGPYLNTLEKYHIYKSKKEGLLFNELQYDIILHLM